MNAKMRHGDVKRRQKSYQTIDDNFSYYPVAYCKHYKAALTRGQMHTHRCNERHCRQLEKDVEFI